MANPIVLSKEAAEELERIAQKMEPGIEAVDKSLIAQGYSISDEAREAALLSRAEYLEWKTRWLSS